MTGTAWRRRLFAALDAAIAWGARVFRFDRPPTSAATRVFGFLASVWPLALIVLGLVVYGLWLDARPFRFEEGRRALQAWAMLQDQAWLRLEVMGEAYANKPPMTPWLMALLGMALGGIDAWAVRLPGVLMAIGASLAAGVLAARMVAKENARLAAFLAGAAFLLTPLVADKVRLGETDVTATAFTAFAFLCWALGRLGGRASLWSLAGMGAFLAAAFLTKGPLPPLFAIVPIVAIEVAERDRRRLVLTLSVIIASALPTLAWALVSVAGDSADAALFAREMRLTDVLDADYFVALLHLNELPSVLVQLLPWLLVVVVALLRGRSPLARPGQEWLVRALVLYAVPVLLVASLWPAARPRYAMPAAWPIAVLAGVVGARYWHATRAIAVAVTLASVGVFVWQLALGGRFLPMEDRRAAIADLQSGLAGLPPGTLYGDCGQFGDNNLYAYAGWPLRCVAPAAVVDLPPGSVAIVPAAAAAVLDAQSGWVKVTSLGTTELGLWQRLPAPQP